MPLHRLPWLTLICLALTLGMAAMLVSRPDLSLAWWRDWHAAVPLLCAGAAWLGGVAADPDRAPERRMQVSSALLLLASVWLTPLMAEWLTWGTASPSGLDWWLNRLAASLAPTEVALPASVVGGFSLLNLANHPVLPRWLSWLAWLAGAAWALALLHQVGGLIVAHSLDAPVWVFIAGLVVLPFQMRGAALFAAAPLWLVCASALAHMGLSRLLPSPAPLGWWLLASLALSLPVLALWLLRIDAIARFDRLQEAARELKEHEEKAAQSSALAAAPPYTGEEDDADAEDVRAGETPLARKRRLRREAREQQLALEARLDSPDAQEGADKYTRE